MIGYPTPSINWFKDEVDITYNPRYHIQYDKVRLRLVCSLEQDDLLSAAVFFEFLAEDRNLTCHFEVLLSRVSVTFRKMQTAWKSFSRQTFTASLLDNSKCGSGKQEPLEGHGIHKSKI